MLALEDLKGLSEEEIMAHMASSFQVERKVINKFKVLLAYESVGDYGCDSSCYFLLRDKKTGKFFETSGSHCSCDGFEGQFSPEEASLDYLISEKWSLGVGGYDSNSQNNIDAAKEFFKKLKKSKKQLKIEQLLKL